MNMVKCEMCDNETDDGLTDLEGKPVCDTCYYEAEPEATVFYNGDKEEPRVITSTRDETEGDFRTSWHSTDGWRGYYEVHSDGWVQVVNDCALAYSEDCNELGEFDKNMQQIFKEKGIEFAVVSTRSSNVFSSGYDVFVRKKDKKAANDIVKALGKLYRDPTRFKLTALTGKDKFDSGDHLLLTYATLMQAVEKKR